MSRWPDKLMRSCRGATAVEFALVLPALIFFLFGTIEAGRLMWTWNKAEKAAQMGVRLAVVTDPVASDMVGYSFLGTDGLGQGDIIPASSYGAMRCAGTAGGGAVCSCVAGTGPCPWGTAADIEAFRNIYNRMHAIMPELHFDQIMIEYRPSGLGYAGSPYADMPEISPIVTVGIVNFPYEPMLLRMFGISNIIFPSDFFQASMTMEDASGSRSN